MIHHFLQCNHCLFVYRFCRALVHSGFDKATLAKCFKRDPGHFSDLKITDSCVFPPAFGCFACMFNDDWWKSYVYRTTFSNIKYQDLCAKKNPWRSNKSSSNIHAKGAARTQKLVKILFLTVFNRFLVDFRRFPVVLSCALMCHLAD